MTLGQKENVVTTQFSTSKGACDYGIAMAGLDPKTAELTEDDTFRVVPAWLALMSGSDPEYQKKYDQEIGAQKGYRLISAKGVEVGLVVASFRDGFCVWGVDTESGVSRRF